MRDHFVIILQVGLMLGIALGPLITPGYFDFTLFPIEIHKLVGLILNITGFLIVAKAKLDMGASFKVTPRPKQGANLVTEGVYSYSRNPIYVGGLCMCLGWGISFGSNLSVMLTFILCALLNYKILIEEKYLTNQFGDEYRNYKKSVRKFF